MHKTLKDYINMDINGMHYVREVKDENGERGGYLLMDNRNRPVKNVYLYIKHMSKRKGYSINTIKRIVQDLCYLYDFMEFNNIDETLLTEEDLYNFVSTYLLIVDPKPKLRDCLQRSMFNKIPILDIYKCENVKVLRKTEKDGLDSKSIARIMNNVKLYLAFLSIVRGEDIDMDKLFDVRNFKVNVDRSMLGHLNRGKGITQKYSVAGLLKAAGLPQSKKFMNPIEQNVVFEEDEEKAFFESFQNKPNPVYEMVFYLQSLTGMRIGEVLALQMFDVEFKGTTVDFSTLNSDITLLNDNEQKWRVQIKVRRDNPKDYLVKGCKERVVSFIDSSYKFKNLLTQVLIYRRYILKKKNLNHNFLFVNRNGERLKYQIVKQKFDSVLVDSGLKGRKGELKPHSFRHTFASKWIKTMKLSKKDIELVALSEALGHAFPETTRDIYIHFFREDIKELMTKMDNAKYQDKE